MTGQKQLCYVNCGLPADQCACYRDIMSRAGDPAVLAALPEVQALIAAAYEVAARNLRAYCVSQVFKETLTEQLCSAIGTPADATARVLSAIQPDPEAHQADLSTAARDVLAERARQISAEGWTPEHDDQHVDGEMAQASGCYALNAAGWKTEALRGCWPIKWMAAWFKPTTPRRDLVKAGALIIAEIERQDRATPPADLVGGRGRRMTGPDRIWIDRHGGNWSPMDGGTQDIEYIRRDPAVLAALPEVQAMIAAAYEAAAKVVDTCNAEGPYQAIGAAGRIRALTPPMAGD